MNTCLSRIIAAVLCFVTFTVRAQHLPNIQKGGFRAPGKVKIDGKLTEWDNKLQARNSATEVAYTIANDDNNLYLIVQATKPEIINKAIRGGITLSINHTKSKTDAHPIMLTYPLIDNGKDGTAITQTLYKKANDNRDTSIVRKQTDSLIMGTNKLLSEKLKRVKIIGTKPVIDTFLSVYNDVDIQVAARIDNKRNCNFEIAIPLKYLDLPANGSQPFAYNVKLNATYSTGYNSVMRSGNGLTTTVTISGVGSYSPSNGYDTDFWGEYTIAK